MVQVGNKIEKYRIVLYIVYFQPFNYHSTIYRLDYLQCNFNLI